VLSAARAMAILIASARVYARGDLVPSFIWNVHF